MKYDSLDHLQEPLPIELNDKRLELFMDIFNFCGVQFLLMESSRVKYVEIVPINSQSIVTLVPIVRKSINRYTARGLQITAIHIDNQFYNEEFVDAIRPTTVVTYAANEHVSVAE